jgi:hypothetical protein
MLRDRFEYIKRCLHLVDNSTYVTDKSDPRWDPIGKIRWYLDDLITSFNQQMNPSPYLCVDESMIAYNGQFCGFKQYLLAKPITHGIKVLVMCCATTCYILKCEVYVGTGVNPAAMHHGEGGMVGDGQDLDSEVDDQVLPSRHHRSLGMHQLVMTTSWANPLLQSRMRQRRTVLLDAQLGYWRRRLALVLV